MNNQEFFTKTIEHLRRQGVKSVNLDGDCKYRLQRGDTVLMCAIGVHIPDRLYHATMEGRDVHTIKGFPRICEIFEDVDPSLLTRMQRLHDNHPSSDSYAWESEYRIVAKEYNLKVPLHTNGSNLSNSSNLVV